jgi:hypothetical protein
MLARIRPLLVVTILAVSLHAQTEIRRGDWRAVLGTTGLTSVHHGDQLVFRAGNYAGYLPGWKGTAFTMAGATLAVDGNRASWHRNEDGKQDCTVSIELTEDGVIYGAKTTLVAAGPSEFGIQLEPEFVRANKTGALAWCDQVANRFPLGEEAFPTVNVGRRVLFETPTAAIDIQASHTQLQDRRARGNGLYLVRVLSTSGKAPREAEMNFTITHRPIPADQMPGRALYLAQIPRTEREVTLSNHDFADGLNSWSPGELASATPDGHEGTPGLKIEAKTAPDTTGPVYVTRSVPVVEGAEYQLSGMVRTQGVQRATIGGMVGTGASVIIEYADKQGKWFAGGAYAKGLYNDTDWRRVTTKVCRAPMGAGSAIIYIALRATGTAWFDDITLKEVRRFPILRSPLPGAKVADNTPALDWQHDPRDPVRVELCRTADFQTGILSYDVSGAPPFSLPKPLATGLWHWRVCPPAKAANSAIWTFAQTASLTQDCTPPAIEPAHAFLPEPRTPIAIPVTDNQAVTRAELVIDGRKVSPKLAGGEVRWTPDRDWAAGLHRAEVRAFDAAGGTASRILYYTHARDLPKRVWLKERGCTLGETPEFPLGMYGIRIEDMPEMAKAGIDLVHNYSWDGTGSVESALEYLTEAQKHGMHAFMGLDRRRLMADDFEFVAERVGTLMHHPGLYAWYLFDEPDLAHQYLAPDRIRRIHELIAKLDPFHPIILTCAGDTAVPKYRDSGTVYWTQVYGDTRFVARRLPKNRQDLRPETAHAAILHCYDRAQSSAFKDGGAVDIAAFQPDVPTLRANAFMALTKQSSGLLWWWWGQGGRGTMTVARAPHAWKGLQEIIAEIHTIRPLLMAEGESRTQILTPKEGVEIHVLEKRVGNRVLLIAVNRDQEEVDIDLPLQLAPANATGTVRVGQGPAGTQGGKLHHRFPPIGVLVVEWTVGG